MDDTCKFFTMNIDYCKNRQCYKHVIKFVKHKYVQTNIKTDVYTLTLSF